MPEERLADGQDRRLAFHPEEGDWTEDEARRIVTE
jgi:hypothetical protein